MGKIANSTAAVLTAATFAVAYYTTVPESATPMPHQTTFTDDITGFQVETPEVQVASADKTTIEVDVIQAGNEVLSRPFLFKTRIGFIWSIEDSQTQFGISQSDGTGVAITADGFKVERGLEIYLFGKKFTIGINLKSETKGACTR